MNKTELIQTVAENSGITRTQAAAAVNALFAAVIAESEHGIAIAGFGSFSVVEKPERQGHNPQTGAPITIPARRTVKFKPAAAFKNAVNG